MVKPAMNMTNSRVGNTMEAIMKGHKYRRPLHLHFCRCAVALNDT